MAFDDNPKVDASSERSEESVLSVRQFLSQKNGFISREEHPDFGVDLESELIINKQATGHRFSIQIKSSQHLEQVTSNQNMYFSLSLLTSRLGKLCRSAPGYGLIVLYDDSTKKAYYDFVEEIYDRLCSRSDPSAWKQQDYVNIHIPITNILDETAAASIHSLYERRFSNHKLLIDQYGIGFGIPVMSCVLPPSGLNLAKPESIAEFLAKYGAALFNHGDYASLIQLIQLLPLRRFEESYELSCLAALVFSQSDRLAEAEYYVRKARILATKLSQEESVLLELCQARIDFHFGRININAFMARLTQLISETSVAAIQFSLMVQIDFLKVGSFLAGAEKSAENSILKDLRTTIEKIRNANLGPSTKWILLLSAATNLHQIGLAMMSSNITALRIKQDIMKYVSLDERLSKALKVLAVMREAMAIAREVQRNADNSEDAQSVKPHIQHRLSFMIASFALHSMMLDVPPEGSQDLLQSAFGGALAAFNEFLRRGASGEAYSVLITGLELRVLLDTQFDAPIKGPTEEELTERLTKLARDLDKPPYVSVVRNFLQEKARKLDTRGFSELKPGEERKYAETIADALGLPCERLNNIIADIKGHRRFAEAINDKDVELLQDIRHTQHLKTMYKQPVNYFAECQRCGYRTQYSTDIEIVIGEFRSSHAYKCL